MEKPHANEIEISVFGPGYGECIVIHLGNNEWIIVDSCLNPKTKNIAVIEYFANIGVNLNSVKLIIATHWHDDHIRGLFKLLSNCPNADFVISEAFCKDEFLELAALFSDQNDLGATEFSEIFYYLLENNKYPIRAIGTRSLIQNSDSHAGLKYKIESLSPSDAAILLSNKGISELLPIEPNLGEPPVRKRRIKSLKPNFSSVVLLITINDIELLLGSDMEDSPDDNIGWLAILNSKTNCNAQFFKIPHHGSSTADNPLVWEKMLQKNPLTVTTPFVLGNVALPTDNDQKRIVSNSGNAFLTAEPKSKRAKTEHFIDKMMKGDVKNRKLANPFFGHVRLRFDYIKQQNWDVTLFKNAVKLS